ncbi:phospholipase A1 member A isoform X3 [Chionomys nivalis]|uniref:phospholipase A1 member A isoform X3 n=1 Tax=Chionomys nivalis TaxID=269649 RepID=UPI0025998DC1|nr:phospholipase A1 member A isoform X3 [Chionomys nivalis]
MPPGLWERCFWLWGLLFWLSLGSSGNIAPTTQPKCTDFQNANFLGGTNLKVQFLLFSSSDPSCGQLVEESSDIQNSKFNVSLGTKLIIHGFRALGTKPSWIDKFIRTLLRATDANVIAVDWVYGSTGNYLFAVENVVKLSLEISRFLSKLLHVGRNQGLWFLEPQESHCGSSGTHCSFQELGVSESSIHIIGVSLGAHVGGMVGHFYKGQLGRITGLDPAGPEYTRASLEERLDAGDARFVEAIHTDTDYLGIRIPVGHVDYFVNGGQDQPGCPTFFHAGYSYLICDHMRAVHLYISALENTCPLMAFPCASYKAFLAGDCLDCFNPFLLSCPRIGLVEQGGVKIEPLPKEVRVYLMTTSRAPYCVHHSLVEFHLKEKRKKDTSIEVTFLSIGTTSSVKITMCHRNLKSLSMEGGAGLGQLPEWNLRPVKYETQRAA